MPKDRSTCARPLLPSPRSLVARSTALAKPVAALPMQYRGQAEFVMDVASMKDFDDEIDMDF
ncbi:MAG: hypothetical protein GY811_19580 [Myxococcales bacterium]|nr:hypothetical protein [Myxococcales bacterium]